MSRGLGSAQRRYHQHLADYLGAPNAVPSPVDNRIQSCSGMIRSQGAAPRGAALALRSGTGMEVSRSQRLRRALDPQRAAEVSGPHHRPQQGPPALDAARVRVLLQSAEAAPVTAPSGARCSCPLRLGGHDRPSASARRPHQRLLPTSRVKPLSPAMVSGTPRGPGQTSATWLVAQLAGPLVPHGTVSV